MNWRPIALPVTCIITASLLVGCRSNEREEGRRKLAEYVASQLEAASSKAAAYDFEGAKALLGELRKYVNESSYVDVPTYDKLTGDIDAAWNAFYEQESEYRKKTRAGWKLIGGKLVSPEDQAGALAQQKRREEAERARREAEQARLAAEAKARQQREAREDDRRPGEIRGQEKQAPQTKLDPKTIELVKKYIEAEKKATTEQIERLRKQNADCEDDLPPVYVPVAMRVGPSFRSSAGLFPRCSPVGD